MKKTQEPNSEYQQIARLAYDNATELFDEARLLLREKDSPRAFTLAVASVEELMKSYLADLVWKGGAKPEDLQAELRGRKWPILTHHGSKHRLFALFLIMQAAKKEGTEKVESVDRMLRETLTTDSVNVKGMKEIVELITSMEGKRQDSLYVGTKVVEGRIKTPRQEISHKVCEDLFNRIEGFLPIVETNLKTSRERYQVETLKLARERTNRNVQSVTKKEKS